MNSCKCRPTGITIRVDVIIVRIYMYAVHRIQREAISWLDAIDIALVSDVMTLLLKKYACLEDRLG